MVAEGLAISPKGDVAVAIILAGSNNKNAYFHKRNGSVTVLSIDGKTGLVEGAEPKLGKRGLYKKRAA